MPFSTIRAAALASAVAFAGLAPAAAAPFVMPGTPAVHTDVIQAGDSAKFIHRGRLDNDGGSWKKRRHFRDRRHERRHDARDFDGRDFDGRSNLYRPKATPKYAYDAYGNYRIYDGDGWNGDWHNWDRRDWDKHRRKRPRIVKMNSFGVEEPSPELKKVLTAVPD